MADDQIVGVFNDGELWLPPDFFSSSSKFTTTTPQTQVNPKPNHTPTRLPDLHLQLFGPMVFKGSNDSVSADYFSSPCNPAIGGGDIWTGLGPLQSFNPVQSQVGREGDWGLQGKRWFLESRVVENRVVRVDGGNGKRGYGGTGVYLPDYTTVETTTLPASSRKRNNVRVTKRVNKACLKRCSPNKAHALKEDEGNFELPPEIMALPQEWTY